MKKDVAIEFGFALLILTTPLSLFASNMDMNFTLASADKNTSFVLASNATHIIIEKDKIFDADILSFESVQYYEKNFNFDWQNHATLEPNKKKIQEVAKFLHATKNKDYSKLSPAELASFGRLYLKLAAYYAHIERHPAHVIECMALADGFIKNKEDKAWSYDYLAYAYAQKFAGSHKIQDKKKALYYTNEVISKLYVNAKNKQVAFAYCVKGMLDNDEKNYGLAEGNFKTAISIYENLPNGKDEQYMRAKNKLATIQLQMDKNADAMKILKELNTYWTAKGDVEQNPYAASNFISLGQAYLKMRDNENARKELEQGINIYQHFYGYQNNILKQPYQLISEAYKNLGNQKQAEIYNQKANAIVDSVQ